MKIVASIEARMRSTRLPGKVLKNLCSKPVLQHIVERLSKSKYLDDIVIATSVHLDDDKIVKFAKNNKIKYFRGSEDDVLSRVTEAHIFMKSDVVVQVTGDSPLIDYKIVDKLIETYLKKKPDIVTNTKPRSYPIGLTVRVLGIDLLKSCEKLAYRIEDREHVTTFIFRNEEGKYIIENCLAPSLLNYPKMRLTLDYQEDFNVISKIYERFYDNSQYFDAYDVVNFMNSNKDISSINKNCRHKYTVAG